ncbi:MAG: SRPBCC family protein [Thermoanaerobaculia bacterium]
MADRIEKSIELKAPVERVWRALTNHEEFGTWFHVRLDGPFVVGETTTGQMTERNYEHYRWLSTTTRKDEARREFAFTWVHGEDPAAPRPDEPATLVEFRLEAAGEGTRLTVVETGFEAIPVERRAAILRGNEKGWGAQMGNIKAYVER